VLGSGHLGSETPHPRLEYPWGYAGDRRYTCDPCDPGAIVTITSEKPRVPHTLEAPLHRKALFSRLAAFSARHRRAVITVWLLVAFAAAPLALTLTGALSGAGWDAQGSTAQQVRAELRRDFPQLGAEDPIVVYHQAAAIASNPAPLDSLVAKLQHAPRTRAVANPLALPASAGLISRDGHTALIPVAQVVTTDASRPVRTCKTSSLRPVAARKSRANGRCGVTSTRSTRKRFTRQSC